MKNLLTRTLTGILYVAILTGGILGNSYTFALLFSVVTLLCLREFYQLINSKKQTKIDLRLHLPGGVLLFIATHLYLSGVVPPQILLAYPAYVVVVFIAGLYEKGQGPADSLTCAAYAFLGQSYIALPLAALNLLAFPTSGAPYHPRSILALLIFIWANDTGAYLIGSLIGKHRLWERISPRKSWEGFFGGLLFTIAASFVFTHLTAWEIPPLHRVGLAIAVALFATWGDLIESSIKRLLDVKDSGTILPGHGGLLDRFDSLLLAVYAMLAYLQILNI
jgi:phosphatidate cytidylyltransferase